MNAPASAGEPSGSDAARSAAQPRLAGRVLDAAVPGHGVPRPFERDVPDARGEAFLEDPPHAMLEASDRAAEDGDGAWRPSDEDADAVVAGLTRTL